MLSDLRVRDLGVIEDLTVRLGPGLTALTGETGAGKTLLVEALQLVLGAKSDPALVRGRASEALIEARFISEAGVELVISRSVPATGRSRAWVDGRMVPVASLAEMAAELLDIHGQHDQQSLLTPLAQRRALDSFARIDVAPLESARRRLREIQTRLGTIGGDAQQRAREADLLSHQIAEIRSAGLEDSEEDQRLAEEEEKLAAMGAHRQAAAAALSALDGDDLSANANKSATDALGLASAALSGHAPLAEWEKRLRTVASEVADIATDLRGVAETWDDDPARLAHIQDRQRLISDLKKKYGPSRQDVLEFANKCILRLDELMQAEEEAHRLEEDRTFYENEVGRLESEVLTSRQASSSHLAAAVESRLQTLAMSGARIEVQVADTKAGDEVRFLLGANLGEPVRPLAQVASGGELARAMLALRLVASGGPPTVVFDEVDAGVGGEAALALAGALSELSRSRQVLAVTHLAQVAALADSQISVTKASDEGRTVTTALQLSGAQRVVEISRMLSGHPDSAKARAHARELLALRPSTIGAKVVD